jgi:Na+/H+ antiporter NhaD/arsenite permease-like protein
MAVRSSLRTPSRRWWLAALCTVFAIRSLLQQAFVSPPRQPLRSEQVSSVVEVLQELPADIREATLKSDDNAVSFATPSTRGSSLGSRTSSLTMLAALPMLQAVTTSVRGINRIAEGRRDLHLARRSGASAPQDFGGQVTNVVLPVLGLFAGWIALMYAIQHSVVTVPFLDPASAVYFPIVATFIVGYLVIVLEEQTEINKASTALVLGVLIWAFVGTGLDLSASEFETDIKATLEDVSEVVFFLLGALTIVEIMDAHKGFDIITKSISATKSRDLLLIIGILTFFLSSILNNLTVVIVMVSLIQKIVKDVDFRMRLGGIIVVASNAGGAWTPIGDITTTMLYIGGQVTAIPLIGNLFVPSILCLVGALGFEYLRMDGEQKFERPSNTQDRDEPPPNGQALVFWGGLLGMVSVPVFTAFTQCPPWSGMMLVLGLLGVITSLLHEPNDERYTLKGALTRVEVPDALFFLGVLFAVGGLERVGILKAFAVQLSQLVPSDAIVAVLLGFASSVVDNVPLVAATQGMYDLSAHPANDALWNLITYCSATGGSLLVIGSAAGVAFMGMEKGVSFGWYTKQIAPAALVGYFFGVGGILAQQALGLAVS